MLIEESGTFQQQLAFGEDGEREVMNYLINEEERTCMPMYQFSHKKAPKVYTKSGEIISPDIISTIGNMIVYVECKRKTNWVDSKYSFSGKDLETGLDLRHWNQYKKLVELTGVELEIYFLQEEMPPLGLYRLRVNKQLLKRWYKMWNSVELRESGPLRFDNMWSGGKQVSMVFMNINQLEKVI